MRYAFLTFSLLLCTPLSAYAQVSCYESHGSIQCSNGSSYDIDESPLPHDYDGDDSTVFHSTSRIGDDIRSSSGDNYRLTNKGKGYIDSDDYDRLDKKPRDPEWEEWQTQRDEEDEVRRISEDITKRKIKEAEDKKRQAELNKKARENFARVTGQTNPVTVDADGFFE